jgi:hypothetical protein
MSDDLRDALARAHEPAGVFVDPTDHADLRDVFARAHEPAPMFATAAPVRRRFVPVFAIAVVAAIVVALAWPASPPDDLATIPDLASPALASTRVTTPLDSLLEVPELDVLATTPRLTEGQLP